MYIWAKEHRVESVLSLYFITARGPCANPPCAVCVGGGGGLRNPFSERASAGWCATCGNPTACCVSGSSSASQSCSVSVSHISIELCSEARPAWVWLPLGIRSWGRPDGASFAGLCATPAAPVSGTPKMRDSSTLCCAPP